MTVLREGIIREGEPCGCGSGQPRRALYDGNGIFCSYVCGKCEAKVRARYRKDIMDQPYTQADVDEDIEPDEEIPQQ